MNKKKYFSIISFIIISHFTFSQVSNPGVTDNYDSLENGKVTIGGLVDTYLGYDLVNPTSHDRPYCVTASRTDEFNINVAFIDLKYKNNQVRAHIVPGFGTYINDNYANESGSLKNLIEANAGVKLFKTKNIWLDAGILSAPYTNESIISKDHQVYTRSLGVEIVPYYLSGIKLSLPINSKFKSYFYLSNGWQEIKDNNKSLSLGTQIEYRPTNAILLNWNTYIGNEYSLNTPNYGTRYFSDVFIIYQPKDKKFSFTACTYLGVQKINNQDYKNQVWWQGNFTSEYKFYKNSSFSGRIEYFSDPKKTILTPVTNLGSVSCFSASFCFNQKITNHAYFRIENRFYQAKSPIFRTKSNNSTKIDNLLIANLTVWF